jgi:hypothetical protein
LQAQYQARWAQFAKSQEKVPPEVFIKVQALIPRNFYVW